MSHPQEEHGVALRGVWRRRVDARLLGHRVAAGRRREVNQGGLGQLYVILLESARPEILAVLQLVTASLERRRPVMVFCRVRRAVAHGGKAEESRQSPRPSRAHTHTRAGGQGPDRGHRHAAAERGGRRPGGHPRRLRQVRPSACLWEGQDARGRVAGRTLAKRACAAPPYRRSEQFHKVALAGLEDKDELKHLDRCACALSVLSGEPSFGRQGHDACVRVRGTRARRSVFEGAPRSEMAACLDYIKARHGSVEKYLTAIGFGPERQRRLRQLMYEAWDT